MNEFEVDPSEIDLEPAEYEVDPSEVDLIEEPGWFTSRDSWVGGAIPGALAQGLGDFYSSVGGLAKGFSDLTGLGTETVDRFNDAIAGRNASLAEEMAAVEEGSAKDYLGRGARFGFNLLPAFAGNVAGLAGSAATLGGLAGGRKYGELRELGVDPLGSAEAAVPLAAVNAAMAVPIMSTARSALPLLGRATASAAEGAVGNAIASPLDLYATEWGTSDLPGDQRVDYNLADYYGAAKEGAITGGIGGGLFGLFTPGRRPADVRADRLKALMDSEGPVGPASDVPPDPTAPTVQDLNVAQELGITPEGGFGRQVLKKWEAEHPGEHFIREPRVEEGWPHKAVLEAAKTKLPEAALIKGQPRADVDGDKLVRSDYAAPPVKGLTVADYYAVRSPEEQAAARAALDRIDLETKPVLYDSSGRQVTGYGAVPNERATVARPVTSKGQPRANLAPEERSLVVELTDKGYSPRGERPGAEPPPVIHAGAGEQPLLLPEPQKKLPAPSSKARTVDADKMIAEQSFAQPLDQVVKQAERQKMETERAASIAAERETARAERAQRDARAAEVKIEPLPGLSKEQGAIETRAIKAVQENPEHYVDRYTHDVTAKRGNFWADTDEARRILHEDLIPGENRLRNADALHRAATWIANTARDKEIARPGSAREVLITSGAGGTGKTTLARAVAASDRHIGVDTTLSNQGDAERLINHSLANGKRVTVVHVWADPSVSAERVLTRAYEDGERSVPARMQAQQHAQSPTVFLRLADRFKDDPRVMFKAIDNTGPSMREIPVEELAKLAHNRAKGNPDYESIIRSATDQATERLRQRADLNFERLNDSYVATVGDVLQPGGQEPGDVSGANPRSATGQRGPGKRTNSEPGGEAGVAAGILPHQLLADAYQGASKMIRELGEDGLPPVEALQVEGGGKVRRAELPQSEKYFQGNVKLNPYAQQGYEVRTPLGSLHGTYRKVFVFPETLAKKFPEFGTTRNAGRKFVQEQQGVMFDLMADMAPYTALKDKTAVNAYLEKQNDLAARGRAFEETPQQLAKLGLTAEEIEAVAAWRKTFNHSLDLAKEGMRADPPAWVKDDATRAQFEQQIEEWGEAHRQQYYFPRSRFGGFFVRSENTMGQKAPEGDWFSMHESKKDMEQTVRELSKAGYDVTYGRYLKGNHAAYDELPPDFVASMGQLDGERPAANKQDVQGFKAHLLRTRRVQGYSKNLERNAADYIVGLSQWYANKITAPEFKAGREQLIPGSALDKYAERYRASFKDPQKAAKLRKFMAVWYLSRPISAGVNMTQSLMATLPELNKHLGMIGGAGEYLKAARLGAEYLKSGERFAKKYPELAAAIEEAKRVGAISGNATDALRAKAQGRGKDWTDYPLILFSAAEQVNRLHAFIAGYEVAGKKGLTGADRFAFGNKLVEDTQYIYDKSNRPEIARGYGALLLTFRLFGGNVIRQLRNNLGGGPGNLRALATQLGVLYGLGGYVAFPLAKDLVKALEAMGYDPTKYARDFLQQYLGEKGANAGIYGLPTLLGINIASNIAAPELAPGSEQGGFAAVGRLAFGVAADPFQRAARAKWLYGKGQKEQAAEQLLPPLLRNAHEAYRWQRDGAIRSPATNALLVDKPTLGESAVKALGGNPPRVARAYERQHSAQLIKTRAMDNGDINFRLATAMFNKDAEAIKALKRELAEHNRTHPKSEAWRVNQNQIKLYMLDMKQQGLGMLMRAPRKARGEMREALTP